MPLGHAYPSLDPAHMDEREKVPSTLKLTEHQFSFLGRQRESERAVYAPALWSEKDQSNNFASNSNQKFPARTISRISLQLYGVLFVLFLNEHHH